MNGASFFNEVHFLTKVGAAWFSVRVLDTKAKLYVFSLIGQ